MRKYLFILLLMVATVASAQKYRTKGYRAFVENGVSTNFSSASYMLATTHGYQINEHIFAGGGMGLLTDFSNVSIPIYADFRWTILDGRVTPFLEGKTGYVAGDCDGFYENANFGVDFSFNKRMGLYVATGYELTVSSTNGISNYGHAMNIKVGLHF